MCFSSSSLKMAIRSASKLDVKRRPYPEFKIEADPVSGRITLGEYEPRKRVCKLTEVAGLSQECLDLPRTNGTFHSIPCGLLLKQP